MFSGADMPAARIFGNSSLATIVRMTLDGIGVSAMPSVVIGDQLAEGRLRKVTAEQPLPRLDFVAAYAKKPDSLMAATIVDLAVAVAAQPPAGLSHR
jgi:DNA-binding transcriptional LysR family regulator